MYSQLISNEASMLEFAARLAKIIEANAVIFLYGPLGAGKTTFARGFLRGLGFTEKVKSPTYTLVEPYEIAGRMLFHFDFYRLHDPHELEYIGLRDYFSSTSICLIEWPEKGFPLLPEPDIACYIFFKEEGREVNLKAYTQLGESILQQL